MQQSVTKGGLPMMIHVPNHKHNGTSSPKEAGLVVVSGVVIGGGAVLASVLGAPAIAGALVAGSALAVIMLAIGGGILIGKRIHRWRMKRKMKKRKKKKNR